jgi:hypothetical protein
VSKTTSIVIVSDFQQRDTQISLRKFLRKTLYKNRHVMGIPKKALYITKISVIQIFCLWDTQIYVSESMYRNLSIPLLVFIKQPHATCGVIRLVPFIQFNNTSRAVIDQSFQNFVGLLCVRGTLSHLTHFCQRTSLFRRDNCCLKQVNLHSLYPIAI